MKENIIAYSLFIGFGTIALFGWFFAIWIPEYRWRIFFTCVVSFFLAILFNEVSKHEI